MAEPRSGGEWTELDRVRSWPGFRAQLPHAPDAEGLLVEHLLPEQLTRVLDLGTGDGHLLAAIGRTRPDAGGVGIDLSTEMVEAARDRFAGVEQVSFAVHDLIEPLPEELGEFDLVVSALAIHHLPDARKRELYAEVHTLLAPGGWFLNVEHVASSTARIEAMSDAMMIDSLHVFQQGKGAALTREQVAREFVQRPDKAANILAPVERQCDWLRALGFVDVDCFFKVFELAVFGGRRPAAP
jgi:tRNA (cmo5U34)-methyltransferase